MNNACTLFLSNYVILFFLYDQVTCYNQNIDWLIEAYSSVFLHKKANIGLEQ